jgi:hypothetical protein
MIRPHYTGEQFGESDHEYNFYVIVFFFQIIGMNIRNIFPSYLVLRRVCRYQRGNKNPSIEGQTTQWPKEKGQMDKQRYTKQTHNTKDRVT